MLMRLFAPRGVPVGLFVLSLSGLGAACGETDPSPSNGLAPGNGIPAVRELGCKEPVASDGGFERCANQVLHRREVIACTDARSADTPCDGMYGSDPARGPVTCTRAACGPLASPTCVRGQSSGAYQPPSCTCRGNCLADSDCEAGNVCSCGGGTGTCVPAGCTSDAGCAGGACLQITVLPADACESPVTTFACTTAEDICDDDADCGGAPGIACRLDGLVRKCVRLPTPCCTDERCGKQCWDASDCGGAACVEASTTYCTSYRDAVQPKTRQCAVVSGACTKDADCKGKAGGESCLWDGKKHVCSSPPPTCLPS